MEVMTSYPPIQTVLVNGEKYRQCAAALVFNSHGQVLVGERTKKAGAWNMPQGGKEKGETAEDSAKRELQEETGLKTQAEKGPLECLGTLATDERFCYRAGGWLKEEGLAGQRLQFCVFYWPTTDDPMKTGLVALDAHEGAPAEFSRLRWASFEEVVASVWGPKRRPYELAQKITEPWIRRRLAKQ